MKTILTLLFLMTAPFSYGVVVYSNNFDTPANYNGWFASGDVAPWYTTISYASAGYGGSPGCLTINVKTTTTTTNYSTYASLKPFTLTTESSNTRLYIQGYVRANTAETTGSVQIGIGAPIGLTLETYPTGLQYQTLKIPPLNAGWVSFTLVYSNLYPQLNGRNLQLGNLSMWFAGDNWFTGKGSLSFDNITIQTVTTAVPEPGSLILLGIGCVIVIMARRSPPPQEKRSDRGIILRDDT
ncbi:MAG TPA: PEP-CTERM sorting domain-containing protein [Chthoniobacterales bacterium]